MTLLKCIIFLCAVAVVTGSGTLMVPPSRGVMWKEGFNTSTNFNYMQLNCGGIKQEEIGQRQCGVCGDSLNGTRYHEMGNKYGTGTIGRYYKAGVRELVVKVELLAFEEGFFEFRICPTNEKPVTQECLNQNLLPIKEGYLAGMPMRYYPEKAGDILLTIAIPPNMTCDRCVLQWRYRTVSTKEGLGKGVQEEFFNCADIRIGGEEPQSVKGNPFIRALDSRSSVVSTGDVIVGGDYFVNQTVVTSLGLDTNRVISLGHDTGTVTSLGPDTGIVTSLGPDTGSQVDITARDRMIVNEASRQTVNTGARDSTFITGADVGLQDTPTVIDVPQGTINSQSVTETGTGLVNGDNIVIKDSSSAASISTDLGISQGQDQYAIAGTNPPSNSILGMGDSGQSSTVGGSDFVKTDVGVFDGLPGSTQNSVTAIDVSSDTTSNVPNPIVYTDGGTGTVPVSGVDSGRQTIINTGFTVENIQPMPSQNDKTTSLGVGGALSSMTEGGASSSMTAGGASSSMTMGGTSSSMTVGGTLPSMTVGGALPSMTMGGTSSSMSVDGTLPSMTVGGALSSMTMGGTSSSMTGESGIPGPSATTVNRIIDTTSTSGLPNKNINGMTFDNTASVIYTEPNNGVSVNTVGSSSSNVALNINRQDIATIVDGANIDMGVTGVGAGTTIDTVATAAGDGKNIYLTPMNIRTDNSIQFSGSDITPVGDGRLDAGVTGVDRIDTSGLIHSSGNVQDNPTQVTVDRSIVNTLQTGTPSEINAQGSTSLSSRDRNINGLVSGGEVETAKTFMGKTEFRSGTVSSNSRTLFKENGKVPVTQILDLSMLGTTLPTGKARPPFGTTTTINLVYPSVQPSIELYSPPPSLASFLNKPTQNTRESIVFNDLSKFATKSTEMTPLISNKIATIRDSVVLPTSSTHVSNSIGLSNNQTVTDIHMSLPSSVDTNVGQWSVNIPSADPNYFDTINTDPSLLPPPIPRPLNDITITATDQVIGGTMQRAADLNTKTVRQEIHLRSDQSQLDRAIQDQMTHRDLLIKHGAETAISPDVGMVRAVDTPIFPDVGVVRPVNTAISPDVGVVRAVDTAISPGVGVVKMVDTAISPEVGVVKTVDTAISSDVRAVEMPGNPQVTTQFMNSDGTFGQASVDISSNGAKTLIPFEIIDPSTKVTSIENIKAPSPTFNTPIFNPSPTSRTSAVPVLDPISASSDVKSVVTLAKKGSIIGTTVTETNNNVLYNLPANKSVSSITFVEKGAHTNAGTFVQPAKTDPYQPPMTDPFKHLPAQSLAVIPLEPGQKAISNDILTIQEAMSSNNLDSIRSDQMSGVDSVAGVGNVQRNTIRGNQNDGTSLSGVFNVPNTLTGLSKKTVISSNTVQDTGSNRFSVSPDRVVDLRGVNMKSTNIVDNGELKASIDLTPGNMKNGNVVKEFISISSGKSPSDQAVVLGGVAPSGNINTINLSNQRRSSGSTVDSGSATSEPMYRFVRDPITGMMNRVQVGQETNLETREQDQIRIDSIRAALEKRQTGSLTRTSSSRGTGTLPPEYIVEGARSSGGSGVRFGSFRDLRGSGVDGRSRLRGRSDFLFNPFSPFGDASARRPIFPFGIDDGRAGRRVSETRNSDRGIAQTVRRPGLVSPPTGRSAVLVDTVRRPGLALPPTGRSAVLVNSVRRPGLLSPPTGRSAVIADTVRRAGLLSPPTGRSAVIADTVRRAGLVSPRTGRSGLASPSTGRSTAVGDIARGSRTSRTESRTLDTRGSTIRRPEMRTSGSLSPGGGITDRRTFSMVRRPGEFGGTARRLGDFGGAASFGEFSRIDRRGGVPVRGRVLDMGGVPIVGGAPAMMGGATGIGVGGLGVRSLPFGGPGGVDMGRGFRPGMDPGFFPVPPFMPFRTRRDVPFPMTPML